MANQQSCYLLSLASQDIIGTPFEKILDTTSLAKWKVLWTSFLQKKKTESTIALKFRTKSGLVISKTAHLTALTESKKEQIKILITIILHSNHQIELDNKLKQSVHQFSTHQKKIHKETLVKPAKSKIRLSFEDIRKIREGHTFILNNLGKDFPSLKDFAHQLGTNEFKLKYGFRELYGTSVYRFLKQERFRKAQMLVQYGDQSIKSIANISGFKSFSHFSRTFKKRYGYTPSELRKKSLNQG
nr:AraC family transcriptional regulator [Cellulophaga sp. F20128]